MFVIYVRWPFSRDFTKIVCSCVKFIEEFKKNMPHAQLSKFTRILAIMSTPLEWTYEKDE